MEGGEPRAEGLKMEIREDRHPDDERPVDDVGEVSGDDHPQRFVFTPPIDIFETDDGLVLHADLPGVTIETLELQVQNNKLTLFGRVTSQVPGDAKPVHLEYDVGDFLRSFILSDEVDYDRINASINNGVLKVELPRANKTEPRRIEVKTD